VTAFHLAVGGSGRGGETERNPGGLMTAHDLLRAWFVRSKTSITTFAETIGVSRQTVHAWLTKDTLPKAENFEAIQEATREPPDNASAVPAEAWFVMRWERTKEGHACLRRMNATIARNKRAS
jgi:transcriptional regulator with XRE-family HTH domain